MKTRTLLSIAIAALSLSLQPSQAAAGNVQVGSCKGSLPKYSTIQAAVDAAPSGATVFVCAGTYQEQVSISQPLTLQGVAQNNSDWAVLQPPATGLNILSGPEGEGFGAQIYVTGPGPVNIGGLAIAGESANFSCTGSNYQIGIVYVGASGTLNHVVVRNQTPGGCGVSLWLENSPGNSSTVTVENSSIHNFDNAGICAFTSPSGGQFTLNASGNWLRTVQTSGVAILLSGAAGAVSNNNLLPFPYGAVGFGMQFNSTATVSGNIVEGAYYPVLIVQSSNTITGNHFSGSNYGVLIESGNPTFTANTFTEATYGIAEDCRASFTAKSNTFSDVGVALLYTNATVSGNLFNATGTITVQSCQ